LLEALPDNRSAILYSLSAMTSYGRAILYLAPRWQMIGSLAALNGWILFGLTTAFFCGGSESVVAYGCVNGQARSVRKN
jgi:hypothetical protein